jgi:hypothetical protein
MPLQQAHRRGHTSESLLQAGDQILADPSGETND